jgi:hypothetical protein
MTGPARLSLRASLLAALVLGAAGAPASADGHGDPTWPCVQRKVEHLSLGVMWPHPVPGDAAPLSPDLAEVAARLALRRVSEEEARALVAEVAAAHPGFGVAEYGQLFQHAFARIDAERAEVVAGIGRYAGNQARLASEVRDLEAEMARLEAAEAPDFDRMDEVEAEMDWRVRVFRDRNRALAYVCESPVLLEQRAYAVAQMLLEAAG